MATTQSSFIRFQTSTPDPRSQPAVPVTTVTPLRTPNRQLMPRVLFALPGEPEDARITGGTRSLDRRLLALNLSGHHPGTNAA
jgi:hypothetical protein